MPVTDDTGVCAACGTPATPDGSCSQCGLSFIDEPAVPLSRDVLRQPVCGQCGIRADLGGSRCATCGNDYATVLPTRANWNARHRAKRQPGSTHRWIQGQAEPEPRRPPATATPHDPISLVDVAKSLLWVAIGSAIVAIAVPSIRDYASDVLLCSLLLAFVIGLLRLAVIDWMGWDSGARAQPGRRAIPQRVKQAVWSRDGGRCVYCGSSENLEFDHVIPHSKGGADTIGNLQVLCLRCNRSKAARI